MEKGIGRDKYLRNDVIIVPFENREYEFRKVVLDINSYLGDRKILGEGNINLGIINQSALKGYEIKRTKRDIYVRLKLYKGLSIADFGNFMEGKRKMVRLRITISQSDVKDGLFSKSELLSYRFINGIDIDLELLKTFILSKTTKVDREYKNLVKQFGEIEERYNQIPINQIDVYLGWIDIEKEIFNKLIQNIINPPRF